MLNFYCLCGFFIPRIHGTGQGAITEKRPVYPEPGDLEGLDGFDEPLPEAMGSGREILDRLHTWGSPATVAQTGGRYFGFVNGAAFAPALAAARNRILENMGWDIRKKGVFNAPRPRVILGEQAHSTVFKALSTLANLQADGTCWCGSSLWQGKPAIHISVCSWATTPSDVEATVRAFVRAREKARKKD